MQKLKTLIEGHARWNILFVYIDRIEGNHKYDFSLALENSKAMLEAIGKEICKEQGCPLDPNSSFNSVLKNTFRALGHMNSSMVQQISTALANIGQQIGNLRNEIGSTSHGQDLDALRERNSKVDLLAQDFLLDTTSTVAIFLIRAFESMATILENKEVPTQQSKEIQNIFNEYWDDLYGDYTMGDYVYAASDVFFSVDPKAYDLELHEFARNLLKRLQAKGAV